MSFGVYPIVALNDACEARSEGWWILAKGFNPMTCRKATNEAVWAGTVINPFRDLTAKWFEKWKVGKVERYVRDTETRLEEGVLSCIGSRPIAAIKPSEIANMILVIEERSSADGARRVLQKTQQIFRYAMAFGLAEQNPAAAFRPAGILKQHVTRNFT